MDLQSLITKLQEIDNGATLSEAAPTDFQPTHFHKNNFGGRTSLMLHSDGNFYHMTQGQYPNQNQKVIAKWNGNTEDRSAMNPASVDGEFVDGKPVEYPEGITWKTFNQDKPAAGTMDTLPTDDQNKTSNYTGIDQKSPEPTPTPVPTSEKDALANDIATATKLLDKAEGSLKPPVTIEENIFRKLVESFGYVTEALKDLSAEEQKELKDAMIRLFPFKDTRADVKALSDRYMALQKEPTKPAEPEKPSGQAEQPAGEEPLLSPEDLKKAVARFKELLDKSLTREKEGEAPRPAPVPPNPVVKKKSTVQPRLIGQGPSDAVLKGAPKKSQELIRQSYDDSTSAGGALGESSKKSVTENRLDLRDLMSKLLEIESRMDNNISEVISSAEQTELTKLFMQLNDPRYASNQDVARELDRYNSVMKDVDKYSTSTFTPGSDKPGMPEVPRQPMPGEKTDRKTGAIVPGSKEDIMAMQTKLKAAGADLGTFGPNKDGIDGNLGGKNSKTRLAMQKFPDIAKQHGPFNKTPQGGAPQADPNTQKPAGPNPMAKEVPQTGIAGSINAAVSGLGTNLPLLMQAVGSIKDANQFKTVSSEYKNNYKEDMLAAIAGDVSGGDADKINRMLGKFGVSLPGYRVTK